MCERGGVVGPEKRGVFLGEEERSGEERVYEVRKECVMGSFTPFHFCYSVVWECLDMFGDCYMVGRGQGETFLC